MTFLEGITPNIDRAIELNIGVLGPSRAGKTTLIRFFETGKVQDEPPNTTLGVEYREKGFEVGNVKFKIYDVGGQKIYQTIFWDVIVQESDFIIYVIDATIRPNKDFSQFEDQLDQFNYITNIVNEDSKVLILLNKQDLEDEKPISVKEFTTLYPIKKLRVKSVGVVSISAKYGNNITEAVEWIVNTIEG